MRLKMAAGGGKYAWWSEWSLRIVLFFIRKSLLQANMNTIQWLLENANFNVNLSEFKLPIVHTCGINTIDSILEDMKLEGRVNEEGIKAVYCFYGLPIYFGLKIAFTRPAVLVFHHETIELSRKIYPFDSGAFYHKLYSKKIQNYSIKQFEVNGKNKLWKINRLLSVLFVDKENYLNGIVASKSRYDIKIIRDSMQLYTDKLCNVDERRKCFEIIFHDNLELINNISKIILPKTCYQHLEKIKKSKLDNFQLLFYEDNYAFGPMADRNRIISCIKTDINGY